jgi:hypothetical protein
MVRRSVEFNAELGFNAIEVGGVLADWVLAAELHAVALAIAE